MGLSYAEAKALGLEHLWPSRMEKTAIPEADLGLVDPMMNRLEAAFWERLQTAPYSKVYREPFKLRLAGHTFYTPDFVAAFSLGAHDLFEVKGFMRDDAAVKLKVAAAMYPCFRFFLIRRPKKIWTVQYVSEQGIKTPTIYFDWLR